MRDYKSAAEATSLLSSVASLAITKKNNKIPNIQSLSWRCYLNGNGEQGMGTGDREWGKGMGNKEWGTGNGKQGTRNGE